MPSGIDVPKRETDFLYPKPTTAQRLTAFLAAVVAYQEGIDESRYQYSATRRVNHAAAFHGGVAFTVIRVSNCLNADTYFEQAWTDAMSAGMPIMLYANVQGYRSGREQAEFAMRTAEPFIKACRTKVVIWGDFEADGLTMSVANRQKLALEFLNSIHAAGYETGIYSNLKYWIEMYGNLKPPAWAWLWGAHWTSAASGKFPSSWDLSRLAIWQYGIWDKHAWAKSVPGNQPDIDKDRWMWQGGDVVTFLQKVQEPQPLPLEARVKALEEIIGWHTSDISDLQKMLDGVREELFDANNRLMALEARVVEVKKDG